MTRLWSFLESLFREAEYHGYGKGKAPKPPKAKSAEEYKDELRRYVTHHYSEHDADDVVANMQRLSPQAFQHYLDQHYVDPGMNGIVKKMIDAAVGAHPDKVAAGARGFGRPSYPTSSSSSDKGSGEPDPIPQRPGRGAVDSPLHSKPSKVVAPGEKPVHAVGSAGQNQAKIQPSATSGIIPKRHDPHDPSSLPRSGVVMAQKEIDRLAKAGETAKSDALARRLGVPTSAERTNSDGKTVVWSPDRVKRFMDSDRSSKDPAHVQDDDDEPTSWDSKSLDRLGDIDRQNQAAKADRLAKDEPISRTDLIKHGILQRQAAGVIKPKFKGTVIGQRWRPHGQSYWKNTARPDAATGNFAHGKTLIDPSKTGAEVVWDGDDWVPAEQFDSSSSKDVAKRAWKASQHPPTRGKHSGGSAVHTGSPEAIPRHLRPEPEKQEPGSNDDFEDDDPTDPDIKA